ncbi:DUF6153 family protein [Streptomyces sp. NPDC006551]|uniref:DUF6153 family protein n=1 Tax=Streptomyces sp. NPDC006551 TaxID=3157178 RepID=UPI0033A2F0FC
MRAERLERSGMRAGGALAHLLLVVVLALGVFVMHSVGHPAGSSDGGATGTAQHGSAAGVHEPPSDEPESSPASSHDSGMTMDMTTLCVAVLSVWLLAGLVRAALGRRRDHPARIIAGFSPGLGPNAPPPRPPDLTELSVLRI